MSTRKVAAHIVGSILPCAWKGQHTMTIVTLFCSDYNPKNYYLRTIYTTHIITWTRRTPFGYSLYSAFHEICENMDPHKVEHHTLSMCCVCAVHSLHCYRVDTSAMSWLFTACGFQPVAVWRHLEPDSLLQGRTLPGLVQQSLLVSWRVG